MLAVCKCISYEKCGKDSAKLWVCRDVILMVCCGDFSLVSNRQVLGVGSLLVGVGMMVNVSSGIFVW